MSQFRNRSWGERYADMGDEAEQRYEAWAKKNRLGFTRWGLNRPPLKVYELPARIRYGPDYLMTKGFVECQGLGRDGIYKLKIEKHGSLRWWDDLFKVSLYVWDRTNERECFISLNEFDRLLPHASLDAFDGDKPYFAMPADLIYSVGTSSPIFDKARGAAG